jgi:hypothetical protein
MSFAHKDVREDPGAEANPVQNPSNDHSETETIANSPASEAANKAATEVPPNGLMKTTEGFKLNRGRCTARRLHAYRPDGARRARISNAMSGAA